MTPTLPVDRHMEADSALVFETEPLGEAVEILGFPEFEVTLASDKPVAILSHAVGRRRSRAGQLWCAELDPSTRRP
ncbi:hypothetical protein [Mesorhizobium sp. M0435]|uniref:hypothetical protein n=1 Tax=Mesorhizobium sp. M0435 TaxID=2956944 RepID=UPI00333A1EE1